MKNIPFFLSGNLYTDQRGSISFVNDFNFENVKRFYVVQPLDESIVRAWQGHQKEQKWLYVVKGSFKVVLVKIDDWENLSNNPELYEFDLNENTPGVLHIPGGYANGFKSMQPDSTVVIFSDFTLEESIIDEIRFEPDKWFSWDKV